MERSMLNITYLNRKTKTHLGKRKDNGHRCDWINQDGSGPRHGTSAEC